MKIVVGSENLPKRRAVESAFRKLYPGDFLEINGVPAESGVSDHPTSAEESLEGAKQRAKHARELEPGASFYVGIEGGLLETQDHAWELGWVAVENSKGEVFTAPSAGIEVRGKVLEAIREGEELGKVLHDQFNIKDAGKRNGYYGLVTDDVIDRQVGYETAIIFAAAAFKHPEYFR